MVWIDQLKEDLEASTPGPWRVEHRHIHGSPFDDEMSGLGLEIEGPEQPWGRGQFARSADARLAAAAPDLARLVVEARPPDFVNYAERENGVWEAHIVVLGVSPGSNIRVVVIEEGSDATD